jgi:hypothetical protein
MPVVRISDSVYERLEARVKGFNESPSDVIERLLDQHETTEIGENRSDGPQSSPSNAVELAPEAPGDLTHTKVLEAEFGGHKVSNPNWNKLLKIAHERALEEMSSFREVAQVTNSNIKEGKFDGKGYHHYVTSGSRIPDFSIQGKKARTAWPDILHLAKHLDADVFVRFKWRDKEKAAHPKKEGILQWSSTAEQV